MASQDPAVLGGDLGDAEVSAAAAVAGDRDPAPVRRPGEGELVVLPRAELSARGRGTSS